MKTTRHRALFKLHSCGIPLFGLLLSLLLLSACGEIAFKRGAGADSLQADQTTCKAAGGDMAACMAARGWTLFNPGNALATVNIAGYDTTATTADAATSSAPAATNQAVEEAAPLLLTASTRKDNRDSSTPAPPPKPVARVYDPLAVYSVSSFWKRGAGRDDLDSAAAACTGKLGDTHKLVSREGGGHRVTASMIRCLQERSWYGLAIP